MSMSNLPPLYKYLVLYDGCDTEDVEYCEELHDAYLMLAHKCMRYDMDDKHPRIEVYKRNQKGDYVDAMEIIRLEDMPTNWFCCNERCACSRTRQRTRSRSF